MIPNVHRVILHCHAKLATVTLPVYVHLKAAMVHNLSVTPVVFVLTVPTPRNAHLVKRVLQDSVECLIVTPLSISVVCLSRIAPSQVVTVISVSIHRVPHSHHPTVYLALMAVLYVTLQPL